METKKDDWEERKLMTNFLEKAGWQLTKNELYDIIQSYDLTKEWEDFKKQNNWCLKK